MLISLLFFLVFQICASTSTDATNGNPRRHTPEHGGFKNTFSSADVFTVCACEHVCGGGEHMNNGCSHKLMVGQIRRDNVNKELLLVHLRGQRWARAEGEREPLKQPVMGESICRLYIHTCDVKLRARQTERETGGEREGEREQQESCGGVNVFITTLKKAKLYNKRNQSVLNKYLIKEDSVLMHTWVDRYTEDGRCAREGSVIVFDCISRISDPLLTFLPQLYSATANANQTFPIAASSRQKCLTCKTRGGGEKQCTRHWD